MARKNTKPVEETEATVEGSESTEATPTPEIDLTDFNDAVEAAVKSADPQSGEPTDDGIKAVQEEYRKLETKGKGSARTAIKDSMRAAVKGGDLERAKALMIMDEKVKVAPTKTREAKEKKVVNPTEAYVTQRATLTLAYSLLEPPTGADENANDKAQELVNELWESATQYRTWLAGDKESRGDEPTDVNPVVKAAAKLAAGKRSKTSGGGGSRATNYTGAPRSVQAHIASAFANVESGTFLKVSEIVKHTSDEYGTDHPSPGAVTGQLKSAKFAVEGVSPVSVDGHLGARKN